MSQESEELVKVCIRIRPEYENTTFIEKIDDKNLKLIVPELATRRATSDIKVFSFDKIYDGSSSQGDIYKSVSDNVAACTRGYNTTIFAYGCTGSGKSYTMAGTDAQPGIIPRALEQIFSIIETRTTEDPDIFFYVRMSYVELYNNNFRNLLESAGITKNIIRDLRDTYYEEEYSPISGSTDEMRSPLKSPLYSSSGKRDNKIEVREDKTAGVFLSGPNLRVPVTNQKEAYEMYRLADKHRSIGATQCNDMSSRSHAILTLHVESRTPNALHPGLDDDLRLGKMHLIDLAGSERLSMSGAEGETLVETQNINLSLTTLGDVISALTKNASTMAELMKSNPTIPWHKKSTKSKVMSGVNLTTGAPALVPVPYRNSKLTHLLKDSLGGNSKTLMITTIRPTEEYYQQTAMSLMYASRAKKIRNQLLINKSVLGDTGIHAVNSELQRLKKRLEDRSNEFERLRVMHLKDTNENLSLKNRLQELQAANESEKVELENQLSHIIHNQAGQLVNQKEKITSLQRSLQDEIQVSQNRIAEQEKEIKWLKRALEDKTQAALRPVEELERMKQGMYDLQNQASNAREEVVVVLSQAEKLKGQNETLQNELNEARTLLSSLQNKHLLESQEMNKELKELNESTKNMKRQLDDAVKTRDKAVSQCEELGSQLSYTSSTAQKLSSQQLELQEKNAKSLLRINELEREKGDLQIKLTDLLGDIENRTALALNGANERIKTLQAKLNTEEEKAIKAERDLKTLKTKLSKVQEDYDVSSKNRDDLILKLKESILQEEEKSADLKRQVAKRDESLEKAKKTCSDLATELQKAEKRVAEKVKVDHKENDNLIREHQRKIKEIQEQNVFLIAKAVNEVKEEYEQQIKAQNDKFASQIDEEVKASIKMVEDRNIKEIEAIKKEFIAKEKDAISKQIAVYEAKIERINVDNNEKIFEIESAWKEKLRDIETNHASAINDLSIHHRNQSDKTIKSQIYEIEKRKESDIKNIKKEVEAKVAEAEAKFQSKLQKVIKDKEALEQKYKEDMSDRYEIEKDLKNNIEDYISQLKKSGDDYANQRKELQDTRKELQSVKGEYKEYKDMSEKSMKLEREEIHERHRLQILNLEHEHETNLQEYLKDIDAYQIKHKQKIAEVIANKEKEISQLRIDLQMEYEKEINDLKEIHILNIEKQKRDLMDKFDNELLKMLSGQEQTLLQERENTVNILEAQYTNDLKEAKRVYDRQLEELMDAQERSLNAKYDAFHKEEEIRWNKIVYDLKVNHDQELFNTTQTLETEHENELESFRASYKQELESINDSHNQKIESINDSHKQELESIKDTHQRELDSIKSSLESDIITLRQAASQALAGQDSVISKLNDLQKKELELQDKHSSEIKSLTIAHKEELEKVSADFEMRLYNEINTTKSSVTDNLETKHKQELETIISNQLKALDEQKLLFNETLEQSISKAIEARDTELTSRHKDEIEALESKLSAEISILSLQIKEKEIAHKKELEKALKDQHDELFSRHIVEMESIHNDKRQSQLQHQVELTEAMESKIAALNAQRIQLETVHSQLVDSLSKELSAAQERYRSTIATAASKQGEEAKIMLEQQLEFSSTLQTKLSERDSQHQQALTLLRDSLQIEIDTSKSIIEQESKKVNDLSAKLAEKENKELEMARTVTLLTQNIETLNATIAQLKEELIVTDTKLRDELAMKLSNEIERHREESKHIQDQFDEETRLKDIEIAELEATIVFRNDEKETLTSSLLSLTNRHEELIKEIEAKNATIVDKDREIANIIRIKEEEISTKDAQILAATSNNDLDQLKADLETWIKRCSNAEKLNIELENEKETIEKEFETVKTSATKLQTELDNMISNERNREEATEDLISLRSSLWESEKNALNEKIDGLTAQLAEKISASLDDANRYSQLLENKESLQKEVEILVTSVEELENTLRQKEDDNNTVNNSNITKVPIRVLTSVNDDYERKTPQQTSNSNTKVKDISGGKPAPPWSVSPKKLSSPSDQLTSAILDGDVQGIRVIIRTMGEDFTSPYWKDKIIKLLPLHRAVSALHFHGNRKLLVSSLESLIQLGANVNSKDSTGNTALHKIIQTCTSKSVVLAVQALLNRGANPNITNNDGESPLYIECCKLRTASTDVVSLLLGAGANPNININGCTPLSMVLSNGIQVSAAELDNEKENMDNSIDEELRVGLSVTDSLLYATSSLSMYDLNITEYFDKMKLSAIRTWLRVINVLINSNANWDSSYRDSNSCSQLHLLLSNFPPSIIEKDFNLFINVLTSCLDSGNSISIQDRYGKTCLFTVCERLQNMPISVCPNAEVILLLLLRYGNEPIDVYLDTKNHDNISINDMLNNDTSTNRQKSCLSKCRQVLLNYTKDGDDDDRYTSLNVSKTPQSNKNKSDNTTSNTTSSYKTRSRNRNKKTANDNKDTTTTNISLDFTPDINNNSSSNSISITSIGKAMTMSDILTDTKNDTTTINGSNSNTPIASSPLFRTAILYSKKKKYTSSSNSTFLVESDDDDD